MPNNSYWIQTLNGGTFDYTNIELPETQTGINVSSISCALSRLPRFAGFTDVPYSVASHSIGTSVIVKHLHFLGAFDTIRQSRLELLALLHDAHEPLMGGDWPSPFKHWLRDCIGLDIKPVETALSQCVHEALDVPVAKGIEIELIAEADIIALKIERLAFMPSQKTWDIDDIHVPESLRWKPQPDFNPYVVRRMYFERLNRVLDQEASYATKG